MTARDPRKRPYGDASPSPAQVPMTDPITIVRAAYRMHSRRPQRSDANAAMGAVARPVQYEIKFRKPILEGDGLSRSSRHGCIAWKPAMSAES